MVSNLLQHIPASLPDELTEVLEQSGQVRIERIVSRGHATPQGQWYDQERDEFVLLVQGRAALEFEDATPNVTLEDGDYLNIKAHVRHRVAWTAPDQETIWLTVHY